VIEALLIPARVHGRVLVRRAPRPVRGVLAGFHGYAEHAAAAMVRLEQMADTHWTLVAVQALNRFYRGRSTETVAGWMTREDRLIAIADNIAYVDAAIETAERDASVPLVLSGFSQGVAMAFRSAARSRRRPQAVIAVGGDVPPELLDDPAATFPDVLLVRGDADAWYTAAKMAADADALAARGAHVQTAVIPGGHEWTAAVSELGRTFLAAFL
jgi:predicted esterase